MRIDYIKTSKTKPNIKTTLVLKESFSDFCATEIRHAETIAECHNSNITYKRTAVSLYINFSDIPNVDIYEKCFMLLEL